MKNKQIQHRELCIDDVVKRLTFTIQEHASKPCYREKACYNLGSQERLQRTKTRRMNRTPYDLSRARIKY